MRTFDLIAIGCSLGGLNALEMILTSLTPEFCAPIAIVQHRYKQSNEALPAHLRRSTHMRVVDVEDGQPVQEGFVYLAPANYHLLVEKGRFSLSVDQPVTYSRPSIDVLFESASDAYRDKLIGVVLTGNSADGAKGAVRIKRHGGFVVAQDPKTAEAPVMPEAAIATRSVDRILPLDRIGPFLVELCHLRAGRVRKRR